MKLDQMLYFGMAKLKKFFPCALKCSSCLMQFNICHVANLPCGCGDEVASTLDSYSEGPRSRSPHPGVNYFKWRAKQKTVLASLLVWGVPIAWYWCSRALIYPGVNFIKGWAPLFAAWNTKSGVSSTKIYLMKFIFPWRKHQNI